MYITIIVVFLTAFLHVLVYLVLRYTTGMTLLKIFLDVTVVNGRKILKHTRTENGRLGTRGSCEYGNVPSDSKNTRITLSS